MIDSSDDLSDVDSRIAPIFEEFLERQRRGECPDLRQYQAHYPDLVEPLGKLLEAVDAVHDLKSEPSNGKDEGPITPVRSAQRIGDYLILREIGRGGMGIVYEAMQLALGRRVALKVLPPQIVDDSRAAERFRREARSAARLHHTNIVPVFDVGQEGPTSYYAMQLISGQGLDHVIDELRAVRPPTLAEAPSSSRPQPRIGSRTETVLMTRSLLDGTWGTRGRSDGPSSSEASASKLSARLPGDDPPSSAVTSSGSRHRFFTSVARIGLQAAEALDYAHRQAVVHRDIKPSNLLLDADGIVWVTDFGLAKTEEEDLTDTGDILGTLRYMAPERLRNEGDGRSDVYALGLTLYELLCLRPAFGAVDRLQLITLVRDQEPTRPRTIDPLIPRDLETIVLKAIEKDPPRRYESASALADDLRRFLQGEPIRARRTTGPERAWKWARRNPAVAILLTLVIATLATGMIISVRLAKRSDSFAKMADKRAQEAIEAEDRERNARIATTRQAARSKVQQAHNDGDAGLIDRALDGLEQALDLSLVANEADQPYQAALRRDLDAWQDSLPVLRHVLKDVRIARILEPADTVLAYVDDQGRRLHKLDLITGLPLDEPIELQTPGQILAIGPAGRWLMLGPDSESLAQGSPSSPQWLYDVEADQVVGTLLESASTELKSYRRWLLTFWPGGRHLTMIATNDVASEPNHNIYTWKIDPPKQIGPHRIVSKNGLPLGYEGTPFYPLRDRSGHNVMAWMPTEVASHRWILTFYDLDEQREVSGISLKNGSRGPNWYVEGGRLYTIRDDGQVEAWDPQTGQALPGSWRPLPARAAARLTADGRTLAVFCDDQRLRYYDIASRREAGPTLAVNTDFDPRSVRFSPGGMFVTAHNTTQNSTHVWQLPGPLRPRLAAPSLSRSRFSHAEIHPEGRSATLGKTHTEIAKQGFVRGTLDGCAGQIDLVDGRPIGLPTSAAHVAPTYSPDGKRFAVHSILPPHYPDPETWPGRLVQVFDAATGRPAGPPFQTFQYIHSLAFSPDNSTLAVGMVAGTGLFDIATGRRREFLSHPGPITKLQFSPDGSKLVAHAKGHWGEDPVVRLWDIASGQPIGKDVPITKHHYNYVQRMLVSWRFIKNSQTILVLDVYTGNLFRRDLDGKSSRPPVSVELERDINEGQSNGMTPAMIDPFRQRVAMVSHANQVRFYDATDGTLLQNRLDHPAPVSAIHSSGDGATLATACIDGSVRIWDTATGLRLGPVRRHSSPVIALAFSPEDDRLRVVQANATVTPWPVPQTGPADAPKLLPSPRPNDVASLLISWHQAVAVDAEADEDADAARWHLDRLAQLRPDDWVIRARIAHASILNGLDGGREQAGSAYDDLAGQVPRDQLVDWYAWRGQESLERGQLDVAGWYFDRITAVQPEAWWPMVARARLLKRLGQHAEAQRERLQAVEAGSPWPIAHHLAEVAAEQGEIAEATTLAEIATERNASFEGLFLLAELYVAQDRWDEARDVLDQAFQIRPPHPGAALVVYWARALCSLSVGDSQTYREIVDRLLEQTGSGDFPPDLLNAVLWICILGPTEPDQASRIAALAESLIPILPNVKDELRRNLLNTIGAALYRDGRPEEAIARLEEAIAMETGTRYSQDFAFLAMTHRAVGRIDQAQSWLERLESFAASQSADDPDPLEAVEVDRLRREATSLVLDATFPSDPFATSPGPAATSPGQPRTNAPIHPYQEPIITNPNKQS